MFDKALSVACDKTYLIWAVKKRTLKNPVFSLPGCLWALSAVTPTDTVVDRPAP